MVSHGQGRLPGGGEVVTDQADTMEFGVGHVGLPRQQACGFGGMKGREEVQIGDIMCVKMLCKLQLIMQMGEFILLFQVLAVFLIAESSGN